ncbi:MAG: RDD family protein [Syntrophorhabdaceae bacterium]|nr:RDD family protein [Syntrophorhabdaceae bacterium]
MGTDGWYRISLERSLDARKARYLTRMVGKSADLIIGMCLWQIPGVAGVLACMFYILTCDAFPGGRSPGKWITGLKTVRLDREPMDYHASVVRNLTVIFPFLLYLVFAVVPFLSYLSYPLGAAVLLIEAYLGFYDIDGQRAGDIIARTLVVEFKQESDANPVSDRRA